MRVRPRPIKPAKAAAAPTEPDSEDPRIARLKKANSGLRFKLREMQRFYEDESRKQGRMTFAAESLIAKALHPDATPSHKDREEALKAFNAWKADSKAARR